MISQIRRVHKNGPKTKKNGLKPWSISQDSLGCNYLKIFLCSSEELFFSLVNPVYLDPGTQAEIQQKFEESSEISLPQFIVDERFEAAATQLAGAISWTTDFTPNRFVNAEA